MLLQSTAMASPHPLAGTVAAWMWVVPLLPLLGFLINGTLSFVGAAKPGPADPGAAHDAPDHAETTGAGHHDDHPAGPPRFAGITTIVGPGVMVLAFLLAVSIFVAMRGVSDLTTPFVQTYFSWMPVGQLSVDAAFRLDQLSMVMMLIVTGVGMLIHIFSVGYMRGDESYSRFFAFLNLFVFFMLVLVMAANYTFMFIGWEGVGVCSYLLIGFWYSVKANSDAGLKAFIVNRIGDVGFLVAMFLMFANFGTLDITTLQAQSGSFALGSPVVTAIALFLLLGCAGKSAQIPLYVWLPDAMAGPTPVSALMHAATMVTAGVYLVVRSGFFFAAAPAAGLTVVAMGALTAFLAATVGLKQWDIKKVLAYSTVSQLGYMFIGVGAGAYVAGIFHLMTHAFFKALLFLGAGSVIHVMHEAYHHTHNANDAQDMRNMGGLRRHMKVTWIMMWIATLAISGIPPFSGFFSKDEILGAVFQRAEQGSTLAHASWLGIPGSGVLYIAYALGLAGAVITAIYMTRLMLYTFHGPNRTGEKEREHLHEAPWTMTGPIVVLGLMSLVGGWFNIPEIINHLIPLGPVARLEHWLDPVVASNTATVVGTAAHATSTTTEAVLILSAIALAIVGIVTAVVVLKPAALVPKAESPPDVGLEGVLAHKYYVDEAYDKVVVRPTLGISRNLLWRGVDKGLIDGLLVNGSAWTARVFGWMGSQVQTGRLGTYAWIFVIGFLIVVGAFRHSVLP
ncbi:MAG TPA: NADH-quinone oxidoreductase subunit L [Gemmatimonadaceae bacterium]|jgi:NADH-quinone oxidoreductase subunit L|nr:NADH-quinone oxidoreductase subunit L [Gemmatimonadaceae bacterium]